MPEGGWLRPPGPVAPGLKIGLLGGSFNPAHKGHLHISNAALARLRLDYVWWLVSPQNPLKPQAGMAPFARRLERARRIAEGHARIVVSDLETQLGTRYTVDTVRRLKQRFPLLRFVWLMGSDNLEQFHRWKDWASIMKAVPVAVIVRPGSALAALHAPPVLRFPGARLRDPAALAHATPPALAIVDGARDLASATAIRAEAGSW